MKPSFLMNLRSDELALRSVFQAHIREDMLLEVAEADHKSHTDSNLVWLRKTLFDGRPSAANYHVREVLQLMMWCPPAGTRGTWIRFFCAATLLQLASDNDTPGVPETLACFTADALDFGEATCRSGQAMLAWRFATQPGVDEDIVFLGLAILLLSTSIANPVEDSPWLKDLAVWIISEGHDLARTLSGSSHTISDFDEINHFQFWEITPYRQREHLWRALAESILLRPNKAFEDDLRGILRRVGTIVVGKTSSA